MEPIDVDEIPGLILRNHYSEEGVVKPINLEVAITRALDNLDSGICPCIKDECPLSNDPQLYEKTCSGWNYKNCDVFQKVSRYIRRRNLAKMMV